MTFRGAVGAELIKILHRPVTWCVLLLPLVGPTALIYSSALTRLREQAGAPQDAAPIPFGQLLDTYSPSQYAAEVVTAITGHSALAAIVFAILVVGSEYTNDTVKTSLSLSRSRSGYLAAKSAAIVVALAGAVACAFLTGAIGSSMAAALHGGSPLFSPPRVFLTAFGYATVGMVAWAAAGVLLATLLRGTVLPIAVALVYMQGVEGLLSLTAGTDGTSAVLEALLGSNVGSLMVSLRDDTFMLGVDISPARALATVTAYIVVFALASTQLLRRRDVT